MKKFLATLLLALFAAVLPFRASAYSKEMAQLATELNNQLDGDDTLQQISYDGNNLVMIFNNNILSDDEEAMLSAAAGNDGSVIKNLLLTSLGKSGLDADSMQLFGQILSIYDANLLIRIPLSNGSNLDITLTPADLSNL